ncbi:AAA family ATPase, partial [bacterium]
FYRLNVVQLEVPPLATRPGDILPLAEHFLRMYSARFQAREPLLTPETRRALLKYSWPGNIRELENVVHSAMLTARDGVIRAENLRFATASLLPPSASRDGTRDPLEVIAEQLDRLYAAPPDGLYDTIDALVVKRAFAHANGNQVHAARLLGISRNILRTLLKRFGLIAAA